MITAQQAKQLYDESGAEVEAFLNDKIGPEVVHAAKRGERTVTILLSSKDTYTYLLQIITPLQAAVVKRLKELGYNAKIDTYGESYVPRGLADDDGHGPTHTNYGIHIGW